MAKQFWRVILVLLYQGIYLALPSDAETETTFYIGLMDKV